MSSYANDNGLEGAGATETKLPRSPTIGFSVLIQFENAERSWGRSGNQPPILDDGILFRNGNADFTSFGHSSSAQ